MRVLNMIREEKEKFRNALNNRNKQKIMNENIKLENERKRQAELAKINAKNVALKRDVSSLSQFNASTKSKSNLMKFGEGLSKVINKAKEHKPAQLNPTFNFGQSNNQNPVKPNPAFSFGPSKKTKKTKGPFEF